MSRADKDTAQKKTPQQKPAQQDPDTSIEKLSARYAAFDALQSITRDGLSLDEAFEQALKKQGIEGGRERAFARQVLMSTLRHIPAIDKIMNQNMDKQLEDRDLATRNWLRLGLAQVLFMEIEDRAAVHSTVELMGQSRDKGVRNKKGLANAVLRNTVRTKDKKLAQIKNPLTSLAAWLRKRWTSNYGSETVLSIARQALVEPPVDLSLKPGERAEKWAETLGGKAMGTSVVRLDKAGDIARLEGYEDGKWWVQDVAATIPARLLGDVKGKDVADLCAAPGGKTLQLAAQGAHVFAIDRSGQRLKRLRDNLKRTGLTAQIVEADALDWMPGQTFEHILLDAPCSATGTIRRHPDLAINKTSGDIIGLSGLQAKLLRRAFDHLAPQGTLLYCTCSLEPEEGEEVINAFLQEQPTAQNTPITADEIAPIPASAITDSGFVRTIPCMLEDDGGMDGFFMARLTKKV